MHGVRGDSIFFVYFFLTSATIAASLVLGISLLQWTVVILALTVVLSAEMFNQSVKSLFAALGRPADDAAQSGAANRFGGRVCRDRRLGPHDRLDPRQSRTGNVSGGLNSRSHDTVPPNRGRSSRPPGQSGLTVLAALRQWLPGASWSAVRKLLAGRHVARQRIALPRRGARDSKPARPSRFTTRRCGPPPRCRTSALVWLDPDVDRRRQTGRHDDACATRPNATGPSEGNSVNPRSTTCFLELIATPRERGLDANWESLAAGLFRPPHRPRHERACRLREKSAKPATS